MTETETPPDVRVGASRPKRRRNLAITVSIAAHLLLAVVLLFIYLPRPKQAPIAQASGESNSPADGAPSQASNVSPVPPPAEMDDVPAEQIEQSVEAELDRAARMDEQEQLTELEKNLRRLESISSPDSVQDVTEKIADTLGLDTDTYAADKTPSEGAFDFDSAQLDDVTRQRDEDGQWNYQSVLVDAEGRKMTVPMGADGETMYTTFEQLKKYPLAESIYRGVVMPMLQSMIEAEKDKLRSSP